MHRAGAGDLRFLALVLVAFLLYVVFQHMREWTHRRFGRGHAARAHGTGQAAEWPGTGPRS